MGFPSWALAEAVRGKTIKSLLQVLLEPVFADFYTPALGTVLDGIERETVRGVRFRVPGVSGCLSTEVQCAAQLTVPRLGVKGAFGVGFADRGTMVGRRVGWGRDP